jgi:hypothetical protein
MQNQELISVIPGNSSTTLIKKPDVFSSGASNQDFTNPWNQDQSELIESRTLEHEMYSWHEERDLSTLSHITSLKIKNKLPEILKNRLKCLHLLHELAEEALPEAEERLNELKEFYGTVLKHIPAEYSELHEANICQTYERPEFVFVEE